MSSVSLIHSLVDLAEIDAESSICSLIFQRPFAISILILNWLRSFCGCYCCYCYTVAATATAIVSVVVVIVEMIMGVSRWYHHRMVCGCTGNRYVVCVVLRWFWWSVWNASPQNSECLRKISRLCELKFMATLDTRKSTECRVSSFPFFFCVNRL